MFNQIDQARAVIFFITGAISIITLIGSAGGFIYLWRFKIRKNCEVTAENTKALHEIKEQRLPYFVTLSDLNLRCNNRMGLCKEDQDKSVTEIKDLIKEGHTGIMNRLDKMDQLREESKKEYYSDQRELSNQVATITANVTALTKEVNRMQGNK